MKKILLFSVIINTGFIFAADTNLGLANYFDYSMLNKTPEKQQVHRQAIQDLYDDIVRLGLDFSNLSLVNQAAEEFYYATNGRQKDVAKALLLYWISYERGKKNRGSRFIMEDILVDKYEIDQDKLRKQARKYLDKYQNKNLSYQNIELKILIILVNRDTLIITGGQP
ncbi:MAG TPA: hypothetical protein VEL47_03530 [Myxococcota bacterium]|nr:hypothetical protein [Myxococcota bacterium]